MSFYSWLIASKIFTRDDMDKSQTSIYRSNDSFQIFIT